MQIVIDIPEGFYEEVRKDSSVLAPPFLSCEKVGEIIANGTPLTEWLNSFDTNSATKCFEAVNILKQRLEENT